MIKNQTDNTRSGSERNKNPFCAKFTAMRKATISLLIFTVSLCFSFGCLLGQNNKPDKKKKKNQGKQRQEETIDYYKKWLEQDVDYIIAKDERAVFEALSTDAERDNFIEQFWFRRDPDPRSPSNEFKTEHYRRIQFANERFHAGMPGWMTDRGRVYIMFGPPDNKESYPAGGWYERKHHEGGGFTSVFPFEVWQYNYIEGVETDVRIGVRRSLRFQPLSPDSRSPRKGRVSPRTDVRLYPLRDVRPRRHFPTGVRPSSRNP